MAATSNNKKILGFDSNVFVSGLVSFFMDFSSEMIYPLVPLFLANVLGVNKSIIGLIEGIAESVASLLRVFSGWLSDRVGNRKWLMAAGYGISTLSRPFIAGAKIWQHILFARFIDRFGKGIRVAPRDALIAESTDRAYFGRAFGLQRAMDTLGAAAGPASAFFLLGVFSNDYRKIFWISMAPALIAVFLIIAFVRERKKADQLRQARPVLSLRQFQPKFIFFVLIMTLFTVGNSSDVFLLLKAQQTGIPTVMIPLVYLASNLCFAASAIPAGIAADRFGKKRIILLGSLLFSIVYYGFAVASHPATIWVLFCCYGVFMGLTEGVQKAFLATIVPPEFKATAYGIYNSAVGIALFPASLVGGFLWDRVSPAATFYYGSITAFLASLLLALYMTAYGREIE